MVECKLVYDALIRSYENSIYLKQNINAIIFFVIQLASNEVKNIRAVHNDSNLLWS